MIGVRGFSRSYHIGEKSSSDCQQRNGEPLEYSALGSVYDERDPGESSQQGEEYRCAPVVYREQGPSGESHDSR